MHIRATIMKSIVCAAAVFLAAATAAHAARIKDLCALQGAQDNGIRGLGLVVGLAGTGDSAKDALNRMQRMLDRMEIDVEGIGDLVTDNIAVVMVEATIPAFAKQGTRINARVNSLYDAESLEGGTLLETMLYGMDGRVYAVARGAVSVGGFNADAGGASVRQNHVHVGRVPMGATIEREIPSTITDGERITLQLKRPDFITADKIKMAINDTLKTDAAAALGAGTINIKIPEENKKDLTAFIARLQDISVEPDAPSRIVFNERTGTLVIGGDVRIRPCQVAHGNLTVTIKRQVDPSQPFPFSEGETITVQNEELVVTQPDARLMEVQGASASEVAETLNALKVTTRDMMAIFQALQDVGALDVALESM